jgi:peroxiredoxin
MLEAGQLAYPFTLLAIEGREYTVPRDFEGNPGILVFFKTSCGTCDLTFPYLNRLRDAYPDGWHLWAVAQDPPDKARAYADKLRITYPVLIDAPEYPASRLYDPPATPTIWLVNPKGRIGYATYGFAKEDLNELSRQIAELLRTEPVVIAPEKDGNPPFQPG